MKSRIEVAKFEPEQTFENTINDIKENHLKIIPFDVMDISAITIFDDNIEQLSMNIRIEVTKLEPEPTYERTIN